MARDQTKGASERITEETHWELIDAALSSQYMTILPSTTEKAQPPVDRPISLYVRGDKRKKERKFNRPSTRREK
jgi:hypothetical protein